MIIIKGTDDYDGNGYNFVQCLSASQNENYVLSYILFVSVIHVGCYVSGIGRFC
jgi:deuterolysin